MRISMVIEEDGNDVGVEANFDVGSLSDVARVVTLVTSAAFEYPVECVIATDQACFDKDGLVE